MGLEISIMEVKTIIKNFYNRLEQEERRIPKFGDNLLNLLHQKNRKKKKVREIESAQIQKTVR